MIRLNQPGLKSFFAYVFGFIFLTLFTYLGIPFFFDYKSNQSGLEKKVFEKFGLNLSFAGKVKYNIFPSPRLNLQNVEILSFSERSDNVGFAKKVILKIPFKKLVSLKKIDFNSAQLIDSEVNIDTSEIANFKRYLNNSDHEEPVELKRGKINFIDNKNLLFSINLKKLRFSGIDLLNKLDIKGEIFNTKIKINYQNKNYNKNPIKNIVINLPEIGLNLKLSINSDEENNDKIYGKTSVFFPNNQIYFDYILNNQNLNISSSRLINNYFKGHLLGDIFFSPFSTFDLKLNIDLLKFKNILNSRFIKNEKFINQFVPVNNKINGKININIDEIASSSNIINAGNVVLEFRNTVLIVKEITLLMNKIGNIKLAGNVLQRKKKKLFIFNTKINLDNSKIFYSRFLIPEKNRIDLVPINIHGKFNLVSHKIKLDKVYFDKESGQIELEKNKILFLQDRINEIFSQNSINNVLKYSNLRKIIQSFFN